MINLNKQSIKEKEEKLNNAEKVLKEEFIGIDHVIEDIINNIRSWYLFPELQEKPIVISLFSMTGMGKTSLVRRLSELLDIKKDTVYTNFAEINDMRSFDIERSIRKQISEGTCQKMFIYDEFQYAATKNERGEEKDNRSALKPFWELMDDGIMHKMADSYDILMLRKIMCGIKVIMEKEMPILKNGHWLNSIKLSSLDEAAAHAYSDLFSFIRDIDQSYNYLIADTDTDEKSENINQIDNENNINFYDYPKFLCWRAEHTILDLYNEAHPENMGESVSMSEICDMSDVFSLLQFLKELLDKCESGFDVDFSKSIIFVIANVDEAYTVSYDLNPDMSPDQFHEITSKLTTFDLKESLTKRFRNEQIARLGNIMITYPSFTSQNFKDIITLNLNNYSKKIKENFDVNISFTDNVHDIIYKDGVFPTQGTRPIFSSIHDIVKNKLPLVFEYAYENGIKFDSVVYDYANEKIIVTYINDGLEVGKTELSQKLRVDNHRTINNKESQAVVAVHESGHFVVYSKLTGMLPEKLCSKCVSSENGGFLMKDLSTLGTISNYEILKNDLRIGLAGYAAEKFIFGENYVSNGASSDIEKATITASNMIRRYGMGCDIGVTSTTERCNGMLIMDTNNDGINHEIRKLLEEAINDDYNIFKQKHWADMLKESALYLSEHTNMSKEVMEKVYNNVPSEYKINKDNEYYQNKLKGFKTC